jgi:hypothetical protein
MTRGCSRVAVERSTVPTEGGSPRSKRLVVNRRGRADRRLMAPALLGETLLSNGSRGHDDLDLRRQRRCRPSPTAANISVCGILLCANGRPHSPRTQGRAGKRPAQTALSSSTRQRSTERREDRWSVQVTRLGPNSSNPSSRRGARRAGSAARATHIDGVSPSVSPAPRPTSP